MLGHDRLSVAWPPARQNPRAARRSARKRAVTGSELRSIKYFLEVSNYCMDAFSRNKQIPKIGTIILDKSLISAPLDFLQILRFVVSAGDFLTFWTSEL